MPYDARPVSEGGNRGMGELFTRYAPTGKFRVIGVDTFDGRDWYEGDFDTTEEAVDRARLKGGQMTKMYVYNDAGNFVFEAGTF